MIKKAREDQNGIPLRAFFFAVTYTLYPVLAVEASRRRRTLILLRFDDACVTWLVSCYRAEI
jgi:hypothetical protein